MVPLPKRRHSSRRQAKRSRALTQPTIAVARCSNCGASVIPHRVCAACGFYAGKAVIVTKQSVSKK